MDAERDPRCSNKMIGRYIISSTFLGRGKFGEVFKGKHPDNNLDLAIKVIDHNKITSQKVADALKNEILIMTGCNDHPHIVKLYDSLKSMNNHYLILEYCAGGDLHRFIKDRIRLSEDVAARFLTHIESGIRYLGENNLLHRDIKPQNILLSVRSTDAILKLADFGLARALDGQQLAETYCGTPLYMAPEILRNQGRYDSKADLWSIGCVLYQMVVGDPPFTGTNERSLLENIYTTRWCIPTDIHVSNDIQNIIRMLLEPNPLKRASIRELTAACAALTIQQEESGTVALVAPTPPAPPPPVDPARATSYPPKAKPKASPATATSTSTASTRSQQQLPTTTTSTARQSPISEGVNSLPPSSSSSTSSSSSPTPARTKASPAATAPKSISTNQSPQASGQSPRTIPSSSSASHHLQPTSSEGGGGKSTTLTPPIKPREIHRKHSDSQLLGEESRERDRRLRANSEASSAGGIVAAGFSPSPSLSPHGGHHRTSHRSSGVAPATSTMLLGLAQNTPNMTNPAAHVHNHNHNHPTTQHAYSHQSKSGSKTLPMVPPSLTNHTGHSSGGKHHSRSNSNNSPLQLHKKSMYSSTSGKVNQGSSSSSEMVITTSPQHRASSGEGIVFTFGVSEPQNILPPASRWSSVSACSTNALFNKEVNVAGNEREVEADDDYVIVDDSAVRTDGGASSATSSSSVSVDQLRLPPTQEVRSLYVVGLAQYSQTICSMVTAITIAGDMLVRAALRCDNPVKKKTKGYIKAQNIMKAVKRYFPEGMVTDDRRFAVCGLCLYLRGLILLRDVMQKAVAMRLLEPDGSHIIEPTDKLLEELAKRFDQLTQRSQHCKQFIIDNSNFSSGSGASDIDSSGSTCPAPPPEPLLFYIALQLGKEGATYQMFGDIQKACDSFLSAKYMVDAALLTSSDPKDRTMLQNFATYLATKYTVCERSGAALGIGRNYALRLAETLQPSSTSYSSEPSSSSTAVTVVKRKPRAQSIV